MKHSVTRKAQALLDKKYDDLLGEIMDIQERIKEQKERFSYDWEQEVISSCDKEEEFIPDR